MSETLERRLQDHMNTDDKNFERLTKVLETFAAIETRVDSLDGRLAKAETNLDWLMKAYWAVVVPLAGGLVAAILALIFRK